MLDTLITLTGTAFALALLTKRPGLHTLLLCLLECFLVLVKVCSGLEYG